MLQRDEHDVRDLGDFGFGGKAPVTVAPGPAAESQAIAAMPAAATPHVHHGLPLPSWREL